MADEPTFCCVQDSSLQEIVMTLEKGVTDDQLGKFYRRAGAIASRLGKSLSFDEAMRALQCLHDGTLRIGSNTSKDLQQLFQRPLGVKNVLDRSFCETNIPSSKERNIGNCFVAKRYVGVSLTHPDLLGPPDVLLGQTAGGIRTYGMSGFANYGQIAAELLGVSDETPSEWLRQLLIRRGYTLTLPSIELLIKRHMDGVDVGLASYPTDQVRYSDNIAFAEVRPGKVDIIHFSRGVNRKEWGVGRYPFGIGGAKGGGSDLTGKRLVIRI